MQNYNPIQEPSNDHPSTQESTIKQTTKQHVSSFSTISDNEITVERMTGITNETYKVSAEGVDPVIYRCFGESQTNVFLNRKVEKLIYSHVSDMQLGPKIYCYIGEHIRIEQFIESKVLKSQDMLNEQTVQNVAFTLQKFHSMSGPQQMERHSLFENAFFNQSQRMLKVCHDKINQQIYNEREQELVNLFKKWITAEEIEFLKEAVAPLEKEGLVFAHNDLLANNILIKNKNGKYVFIDYEYSSFNYPICDIGNYFNETTFDYDNKEPPFFGLNPRPADFDQKVDRFLECYLIAKGKKFPEYKEKVVDKEEKQRVQEVKEKMKKRFPLGTMLSNVIWGWWAVIVCKNPNIQFDYLEFCKVRYDNYYKVKNSGLWKVE